MPETKETGPVKETKESTQESQNKLDQRNIDKADGKNITANLESQKSKSAEAKDIKDPWENVFDKDGKYKQEYLTFVNTIANSPVLLKKVIDAGEGREYGKYVKNEKDFTTYSQDHKVGDLHDYLKDKFPDMNGSVKEAIIETIESPEDIQKILESNKIDNMVLLADIPELPWKQNILLYDFIKIYSKDFIISLNEWKEVNKIIDDIKAKYNAEDKLPSMTQQTEDSWKSKNYAQAVINVRIKERFRTGEDILSSIKQKNEA